MSTGQRRLLIHVFRELANFGVISVFFGQFLGERQFSTTVAAVSVASWTVLIAIAFGLAAKETK